LLAIEANLIRERHGLRVVYEVVESVDEHQYVHGGPVYWEGGTGALTRHKTGTSLPRGSRPRRNPPMATASRPHLLRRRNGRTGRPVGVQLGEPAGNRRRNELVHLASERRDLLDAARGDEAVERARHDVERLDLGREQPVQVVHLELPLEVRDDTQP